MLKNVLKNIVVLLLVAVLFSAVLSPEKTSAQVPFGGPITFIHECVNGIWVIVGAPAGGSYMWLPGTISYREGPPKHEGQYLLGMAGGGAPCLVPCEGGLCPIGWGMVIQFHGSSI